MQKDLNISEQNFIEEVGMVFEQTGLPRMSGRILGWLLIAATPQQSSAELAGVLMASKGSISTATRLLIQLGLVERSVIPGVRHDYFRLRQDAMQKIVRHGLEDEIKMFRQLAEHGLELLGAETSLRRQWLEEMRDRYAFLEQEFPSMMERWEKWQSKEKVRTRAIKGKSSLHTGQVSGKLGGS